MEVLASKAKVIQQKVVGGCPVDSLREWYVVWGYGLNEQ